MAKKDKVPTPNPAGIPNKDIIQRLNFLYQASVYLTKLSYDVPTTDVPHLDLAPKHAQGKTKSQHAKQSRRRLRTIDELACAYVDTMTVIGKRATVKMDPSVKRTLCKSCRSVLLPGVSVTVRVRRSSSHKHALVLKCTKCGYARRVPAPEKMGWDGRGRWDVVDDQVGAEAGSNASPSALEKEQHKKQSKKRVYPPLPLSARRDVGHIIFRRDERVEMSKDEVKEVGDGVFAV